MCIVERTKVIEKLLSDILACGKLGHSLHFHSISVCVGEELNAWFEGQNI